MLKICILCENYARKRFMMAEHGLSIWIETNNERILFDTGQSGIFSVNAEHLGIDIAKADMVVLSHGHYDHTGGVPELCRINNKVPVYIHEGAFQKRYHGREASNKDIGIPWVKQAADNMGISSARFILNKGPVTINDHIIISGEIPNTVAFENMPQNFYIDDGSGTLSEDRIIDEQILLIKGIKGVYVFVGCSHAGVINCISYARKLFPGEKIAGVIGGMHLEGVSEQRLQMTIRNFLDIDSIIPMHCTGMMEICRIKQSLKNRCKVLTVGDELILEK